MKREFVAVWTDTKTYHAVVRDRVAYLLRAARSRGAIHRIGTGYAIGKLEIRQRFTYHTPMIRGDLVL